MLKLTFTGLVLSGQSIGQTEEKVKQINGAGEPQCVKKLKLSLAW